MSKQVLHNLKIKAEFIYFIKGVVAYHFPFCKKLAKAKCYAGAGGFSRPQILFYLN